MMRSMPAAITRAIVSHAGMACPPTKNLASPVPLAIGMDRTDVKMCRDAFRASSKSS